MYKRQEVDCSLGPEIVGNVGEHGVGIAGLGLIAHSVGNHGSELRTSGSAGGIEGAVAHAGNVAVLGSIHHVIIEPVAGVHVGEGDALVYLMTGVTLGFFGNIELLTLSLFFSAIVSVFLLVFRKVGKKKRIPFVPFTAIAYGVVMVL